MKVWDVPTRLFHWSLVALVATGVLTGFVMPEWWMGVHVWAGFGMVALIAARLVWGVVGPEYSRVVSFVYPPRSTVEHVRGLLMLVFPPQFLPARSWQKLVDGLSSHSGEDVTLPAEQRAAVLERLRSMAADAPGAGRAGSKFLAGLAPGETPLRITETPRWVKEHRNIRPEKWTSPAAKSKLNCAACHEQAEAGVYED